MEQFHKTVAKLYISGVRGELEVVVVVVVGWWCGGGGGEKLEIRLSSP